MWNYYILHLFSSHHKCLSLWILCKRWNGNISKKIFQRENARAGSEKNASERQHSCQWREATATACFTFLVSSLRVSQQQPWEINSLIMVRSTRFLSTHLQRLLETSDKTLCAGLTLTYCTYLYLHRTVKGSISLLYTDHPHVSTVTCCTTCMTGFPWKCVWGAAFGFGITLNFKEHTYQLPEVAVKMPWRVFLAWKILFMASCWINRV